MEKKKSVVQDWLLNLSWKQQTVLLAATRGCDGVAKEDPSKLCLKVMRSCILENVDTDKTDFMSNAITKAQIKSHWDSINAFLKDIEKYPMHYVMHFMHAAEILCYKHPSFKWKQFWGQVYLLITKAMHLHMESEEELDYRLRDGVDPD